MKIGLKTQILLKCHHESISWNLDAVNEYKNEMIEGINWLDKDLLAWSDDLIRIDDVIEKGEEIINNQR